MDTHIYQLTITRGPEPGTVIPLTSGTMTIGRDPMSEITINDPEVSRRHASLTATLSGYQIQDLGSTNGTFIDGVRLGGDPLGLESGQIITIGGGVALLYQSVTEVDAQAETILEKDLDLPLLAEEPELIESSTVESADDAYLIESSEEDSLGEIVTSAEAVGATEEQWVVEQDSSAVTEEYAEADEDQLPDVFSSESDLSETPLLESEYEEAEPATSYEADDFSQPVVIPHEGEDAMTGEEKPPFYRRMSTIIAAIVLLMLCCCCGFLLFFYYVGGDWLLRQMGLP